MHRRRFLTVTGSALLVAACAPTRTPVPDGTDAPGRSVPDEQRRRAGATTEPPAATRAPRTEERPPEPAPETEEPAPETEEPAPQTEEAPETEEPAPQTEEAPETEDPAPQPAADPDAPPAEPTEWGLRVTGVRTRLATDEPVVALTFDACGGPGGSGYDAALLDGLLAAGVPATLFVNARWARANPGLLRRLAAEPRFELANHGTEHRPLSVTGRSAYGIAGTASRAEVLAEVDGCQELLTQVTGRPPRHFRSGTAHYDEVAVALVQDLGLEVVNFDVLGDAGATYTAAEVTRALLTARGGSIVLLHMNQPGSGTARGVLDAIPQLRDRGLSFTTLGDRALA